jgi:hypothetical protein
MGCYYLIACGMRKELFIAPGILEKNIHHPPSIERYRNALPDKELCLVVK